MQSAGLCRFRCSFAVLVILFLVVLFPPKVLSRGDFELPALPAPEVYGDVMIDRTSRSQKVVPVVFSHRVHRALFTCRVCHLELEFVMKTNDTGIVCNWGRMEGKYCAVCHNGRTAFGPRGQDGEHCSRCHNADERPNRKKYTELKNRLPSSQFGDGIDWSKAFTDGLIEPKKSLSRRTAPLVLDRTLTLEAEMSGIPPAVFPHKIHTEWIDCAICHPEIFTIKKKTTTHFSMSRILNNEFCGVCHLRIAFPLNDCKRCHPALRR